jgi:hypothetical protein
MIFSCFPRFLSSALSFLLAGLDARITERSQQIFYGLLLAQDPRRTASSWFRAAGIGKDFKLAYRHLGSIGRKSSFIATRVNHLVQQQFPLDQGRIVFALDDTLTKRYGPKVEGAGFHHNPTPGPSGSEIAYGHNFVVLARVVEHPEHGTIGLPLNAHLYVREKDVPKIPVEYEWEFKTKLELGTKLLRWACSGPRSPEQKIWIAADGGYAKKEILDECRKLNLILVSRLRKDAALYDLPNPSEKPSRGRPRIYGENRISLAKRAAHPKGWTTSTMTLYGKPEVKTYKTFLATWKPAGGAIRVVLVRETDGWVAFFSNHIEATVEEILGTVSDRNVIEQVFKDVKEVWGAGKQQLRNIHANVAAFNMNLWMMTLTELWAWDQPVKILVDRSARPWDKEPRRPSHSDRRKALISQILRDEFRRLPRKGPGSRLFRKMAKRLLRMVC